MQNFQIESAQNVNIQHKLANLGERFLAFCIDLGVLFAYYIGVGFGLGLLQLGTAEGWVYGLVLGLPIFLYHLLMETFMNGQSVGKLALKIRVVKLDGGTPGFSDYLLRWLLRIVDFALSMGSVAVVTFLFNGKGQRLGDIAAKTTVISEKKRISYQDTLHVDLPENYQPKYPQASIFSDSEIQTIKGIFMRAKLNSNHKVILTLSRKIAKMMDVHPEERPVDFLEIVISDYNYYAQG